MNMNVFGLLHLAEDQPSAINLSRKGSQDHASVYLNNAIVLSKTLSSHGIAYTLLTNNKSLVEDLVSAESDGSPIRVIEIPFTTDVPPGTSFYSAHFKVDALRYLASLPDGYAALCDLDMVCINAMPPCLYSLINAGIPLCYDISDQVIPRYGHDVIIRDLSVIGGLESEGRWSGGEFIAGTPEFFSRLVGEIDEVYATYISYIPSLHHVGDEAFVSAALERLRRQGVYIADVGTLGVVGRYWNTSVLHPQKPFSYFGRCFLLHLPADKEFLSGLALRNMEDLSQFNVLYARQRRSILRMMKQGARYILRSVRTRLLKGK